MSNARENSITRVKKGISKQLEFFEATEDTANLEGYSLGKSEDIGFHFNPKTSIIRIPECRLENPNFELGLAHELTEMLLRKLVYPIVGMNGNPWYIRYTLHEATVLSIEKYAFVAHEVEYLEADFEKVSNENLKLPAKVGLARR